MSRENSQSKMKREEQEILNELIQDLDKEALKLNKKMTSTTLDAKKEKEKCLPDTYGELLNINRMHAEAANDYIGNMQARDELYEYRLGVEVTRAGKTDELEMKIGLHSYTIKNRPYIYSWMYPVCRYYILDNAAEQYQEIVKPTEGRYRGQTFISDYELKMKRRIQMRFDKVKDVAHYFPTLGEEEEDIIADEFLKELADRRSDSEFRNIVFSIQKQQGEIIQTPFEQDIIVQGCAGSGKSMIMLHRLPILLYDNPNRLSRNSMYIITPSEAYIYMADSMRRQLEISDLNMGTLEHYYDSVIEKYGRNPEEYGKRLSNKSVSQKIETHIYSRDCIQDIMDAMQLKVNEYIKDYNNLLFSFPVKDNRNKNNNIRDMITGYALNTQTIIRNNTDSLKKYFMEIRDLNDAMNRIATRLSNRKVEVVRGIQKKITENKNNIEKATKEINKFDDIEKHQVAYDNRMKIIEAGEERISKLEEVLKEVEGDEDYFLMLQVIKEEIEGINKSDFDQLNRDFEKNDISYIIELIEKRAIIGDHYYSVIEDIQEVEDKYTDFADSVHERIKEIYGYIYAMENEKESLFSMNQYDKMQKVNSYYSNLSTKLPELVYGEIMDKTGFTVDDKQGRKKTSFSPYLYCQILYLFQGEPNANPETLITIDEAQGLAETEIDLIKKVNQNKVILNLFGDYKQHVEGTKGLDSWEDVEKVASFEVYEMKENYRNARQITEYCNKRFNMKMRAINLDGSGVHEQQSYEELKDTLVNQFLNVRNKGLAAIIVANKKEARKIIKDFKKYKDKIHDMTGKEEDFHRTRWNLMIVDQVKGLEFESVVAITGTMTENEKYIAYTRALDELIVFDKELDVEGIQDEIKEKTIEKEESKPKKKTKKNPKRKEVDYSKSEVRKYFETAGLKVSDFRSEGGYLWVHGAEEKISMIVDIAIDKFHVSGGYMTGKPIGNERGWYTKTKK